MVIGIFWLCGLAKDIDFLPFHRNVAMNVKNAKKIPPTVNTIAIGIIMKLDIWLSSQQPSYFRLSESIGMRSYLS